MKQTWKVLLNDKEIARLPPDENDMVLYFPVAAGALREGENHLVIEPAGRTPDDVRVREVALDGWELRATRSKWSTRAPSRPT